MKILICDDDVKIVDEISDLIDKRDQFTKTELKIDKRLSGDFVLSEAVSYDIAFIDIEMPAVNGLTLAEKLKEINPDIIIIIITSFSNYLDDAMKIKVFRYISKPINHQRLMNSLYDGIREYYNNSKTIVVDLKSEVFTLKTKDILYLENMKHGTILVTRQGEFKTNKKIDEWLKIIDQPKCFIHSHKSFVVNLQNIINFNNTSVQLRKGENEVISTYISQRKFSEFKKAFMNFIGENL